MLTTDQAILARRSVRGFLPQPVEPALLRRVFELAQHAPSNCNTQPWAVHVVSGAACEALRARLLAAARDLRHANPDFPFSGQYDGAYRDRQVDAAARLFQASGIAREDRAARMASLLRNYALFDAPHAAFLFLPEPFGLREAADCGMWAQTLMLALAAHGLASCPQTALSMFPDLVRSAFGLPATHRLLIGLSIGYEDTAVPANACRVGREPLERCVSFHDTLPDAA